MSGSCHAMARGSGWGSDVLGRKDTNDKASGLIILETVPSLQMRDIFSSPFMLVELSQGHSGPAAESWEEGADPGTT